MNEKVSVFFYGSFINLDVLGEGGLVPADVQVAKLEGHDILIQPLANLVPSEGNSVFGIVCQATHAELDRLYRQTWVGIYLPHPVLVETMEGVQIPALCYLSPSQEVTAADRRYINRILGPAREYGFPAWYVERIERFGQGPVAG
jgi:hypothetical protein